MNINKYIEKIKGLVPGEMTKAEQSFVINTLEVLLHIIADLQKQVQDLKDEINRLKGEQGKPDIKGKNQKEKESTEASEKNDDSVEASKKDDDSIEHSTKQGDISSESERKPVKKRKKKKRVKFDSTKRIDEIKILDIEDKSNLPEDAVFKGFATSHYQDLEIKATLIQVRRAIYYSASQGKTYTAPLPDGYEQGEDYSGELKGHVVMLKYEFGMSVPQIGNFLRMNGVNITNGTVSNILLRCGEALEEEYKGIHQAGLAIGLFNQSDTTGARVDGLNQHSHVFGNEYYTAYFTRPHKDRQTILDLLRAEQPRHYLLNEATLAIYDYLKVPKKIKLSLIPLLGRSYIDSGSFQKQLKIILTPKDYERQVEKLLEGAYLAHYQSEEWLSILVVDDAPQYKLLATHISLCWVHIGRHFKKLNPKITYHQKLLNDFLTDFWHYYHRLLVYKQAPDPLVVQELIADFDRLFSRKTGYDLLDQRIAKTKAKRKELLVALKHPYVPLHNNASELAARKEVRYRDNSFQTRNKRGTLAKDVFFTIIQTCKKLGLNAYAYILDRVANKHQMPSLVNLMALKANA